VRLRAWRSLLAAEVTTRTKSPLKRKEP